MNYIKSILTTLLVVFTFAFIQAQESKVLNYSNADIENSGILLSDNWSINIEYNVVQIYNGSIKNDTNKNLTDFNLDLFLCDNDEISDESINGLHLNNVVFKSLRKKSTIAGVNIKSESLNLPESGTYIPILVISDKRGKVLAIKEVNRTVYADAGNISLKSKTDEPKIVKEETEKTQTPVVSNTIRENTGEISPQSKLSLVTDIDNIKVAEDNKLVLDKEWKVEIDFKNFLVKLNGGDIANLDSKNHEDIAIEVYLTNESLTKITSNFNGMKIASSDLGIELDKGTKAVNTNIVTNLVQIPEPGTYYVMVTLLTKNDGGDWVVRSKRNFPNSISF